MYQTPEQESIDNNLRPNHLLLQKGIQIFREQQ